MKNLRSIGKKEQAAIANLIKQQHKLHMLSSPVCSLEIIVSEKNRILSRYESLSKSWVRNMYNFLAMQTMGLMFGTLGTAYGAGTVVMRNNAGTGQTSTANCASVRARAAGVHSQAAAGIVTSGIVAGTSSLAESFEHHTLGALCVEGTGLNQLAYLAQAAPSAVYDPGTRRLRQTLTRIMVNNSAASITIAEIALRLGLYIAGITASTLDQFMVARDVLSPAVVMPIGASLTVNYNVDIFYPA